MEANATSMDDPRLKASPRVVCSMCQADYQNGGPSCLCPVISQAFLSLCFVLALVLSLIAAALFLLAMYALYLELS